MCWGKKSENAMRRSNATACMVLLFITAGMVVERKPCVRGKKGGECDEEVECHG